MDIHSQRQEYSRGSLDIESMEGCPYRQFESWFVEASDGEILEPNAMVLSTVSSIGFPTQRTVLLKYFDQEGFVFFTDYRSRKSKHIETNRSVSALFPWYPLQRQVEISGMAERVSPAEALKYFALRPRGSQMGAWVSEQSSVVSGRQLLRNKWVEIKQKFKNAEVPCPPTWGGFRIRPTRFEFWQGGVNRLHDRIEFRLVSQANWKVRRLSP